MRPNDSILELMTQPESGIIQSVTKGSQESTSEINSSTARIISDTYLGDALNDDNINNVINKAKPHLAVLVGFPEYGKSTFVSSLYHVLLTEGRIGDCKFVNSETILGFERRTFVRRYENDFKRRLNRTALLENYFLTIDFLDNNNQLRQLVVSDRSGEAYKEYCHRAESLRQDKAIKHTNHLIFFLDATKIDVLNIVNLRTNVSQLVKRFKTESVIKEGLIIDVIFNKIDKINHHSRHYIKNKEEIIAVIESESQLKINKCFEINSDKTVDNDDLKNVFIYLVESCDSTLKMQSNVISLDWVKNML